MLALKVAALDIFGLEQLLHLHACVCCSTSLVVHDAAGTVLSVLMIMHVQYCGRVFAQLSYGLVGDY